jgi:hypothetical protein
MPLAGRTVWGAKRNSRVADGVDWPQLQCERLDDFEVDDMSGRTIWYFVKFFAKESHADQFIKGGLYLNRLSYFKKIENDDEDGRCNRI